MVLPTGEQEDFIKVSLNNPVAVNNRPLFQQYLISAFSLKLFHTAALLASQVMPLWCRPQPEPLPMSPDIGGRLPPGLGATHPHREGRGRAAHLCVEDLHGGQRVERAADAQEDQDQPAGGHGRLPHEGEIQRGGTAFRVVQVVGLENLATADPHNRLWSEEGQYMAETSYVCR